RGRSPRSRARADPPEGARERDHGARGRGREGREGDRSHGGVEGEPRRGPRQRQSCEHGTTEAREACRAELTEEGGEALVGGLVNRPRISAERYGRFAARSVVVGNEP